MICGAGMKTYAQSNISSIVPSSAPAFTVLGISPVEISKPNNWNALQASLFQNFVSNDQLGIPKTFSLEFTPYWLKDRPNFTYKNYLDKKAFSLRNLSLSLASSKVPYGADTVQAMGFGFRLPVMTGNGKSSIAEMRKDLETFIDQKRAQSTNWQSFFSYYLAAFDANATIAAFRDSINTNLSRKTKEPFKSNSEAILSLYTNNIAPMLKGKDSVLYGTMGDAIVDTASAYYNVLNTDIAKEVTDKISATLRDVSQLEFAGGLGLAFPTNDFTFSKATRASFWGNYSFNISTKGKIDGTVGLRYMHDFSIDTIKAGNNYDAIFRLNLAFGTKESFTISAWGVLRYKTSQSKSVVVNGETYYNRQTDADNKYGIDISYKLSDNVALSYSFGKGYGKDNFLGNNGLINYLNLFYALSTKVQQAKNGDFGFKTF